MKPTSHIPYALYGEFSKHPVATLGWRLLAILGLFVFFSTGALAQILPTYCDGNPADLANFVTTYPIHAYTLDVANSSSNMDDQFTQGTKDGSLVSAMRWSKGNANAKGDITNAGAALTGDNNCILRFFGDRTSDNGDASIGFWFYRSLVSTRPDGTFSGVHTDGDILILSDFTSGGTQPTIKVYEWLNNSLVLQSGSTARCADVNHVTQPVPVGFQYTASDGSTSYAPNLFFEGAIDLCALNIPTCFAAFLVETRNSQSIGASLQDFAIGRFNATPSAPAAANVARCGNGTVTLTATGCAGVPQWYTAEFGGTAVATGSSFTTPALTTSTDYYVSCKIGTCESGRTKVTAIIRSNPAAPVVTVQEATVCGALTAPTLTVCSPVVGVTYRITDADGTNAQSITYSSGALVFTIRAGKGFSITATASATNGGCSSGATTCGGQVGSCPVNRVSNDPSLSPTVGVNSIQTEAFPNPTGQDATINFSVPKTGHVLVQVYNITGARVATLFDGEATAGEQRSVVLKGTSLAAGTYTYRVTTGGKTRTNRVILEK